MPRLSTLLKGTALGFTGVVIGGVIAAPFVYSEIQGYFAHQRWLREYEQKREQRNRELKETAASWRAHFKETYGTPHPKFHKENSGLLSPLAWDYYTPFTDENKAVADHTLTRLKELDDPDIEAARKRQLTWDLLSNTHG